MAPVFPTTLAIVGDVFPVMTATAMGIVITFGWLGLAVSSPVIGAVAGGGFGQSGHGSSDSAGGIGRDGSGEPGGPADDQNAVSPAMIRTYNHACL